MRVLSYDVLLPHRWKLFPPRLFFCPTDELAELERGQITTEQNRQQALNEHATHAHQVCTPIPYKYPTPPPIIVSPPPHPKKRITPPPSRYQIPYLPPPSKYRIYPTPFPLNIPHLPPPRHTAFFLPLRLPNPPPTSTYFTSPMYTLFKYRTSLLPPTPLPLHLPYSALLQIRTPPPPSKYRIYPTLDAFSNTLLFLPSRRTSPHPPPPHEFRSSHISCAASLFISDRRKPDKAHPRF